MFTFPQHIVIEVAKDGFDWLGFFVSVAQTTIGAVLGFLLGVAAFWLQSKSQDKRERQKDHEATIDALQRLLSCAWLNLEALAMIKIQLLDDLRPEIEDMRKRVEAAYADDKAIARLVEIQGKTRYFYKGMPELSVMPAPTFEELSPVFEVMPALTTFVHRAMSSMHDLNDRISARNVLITEHARENGGDGLSSIRLLYFSAMLTDEGRNLYEIAENAMAFFQLVRDQVQSYLDDGLHLKGYARFEFLPEVEKRLPKEERFPRLRAQFRDFKKSPLGAKDS